MALLRYAGEIAMIIVLLAMVLIGVLTITHGTPVRGVISPGATDRPPTVGDSLFAEAMELYTSTHFSRGNIVTLCLNGDGTYPKLWDDLSFAKHTITVQMYYSEPGKVTDDMRDHLAERARAGVRVLVLLDAFGSGLLRKTNFVSTLRAAGARVAWLTDTTIANGESPTFASRGQPSRLYRLRSLRDGRRQPACCSPATRSSHRRSSSRWTRRSQD